MPTLRVSPVQTDNPAFDQALVAVLTEEGFERIAGTADWSRAFDSHADADGAAEVIEAEIEEISENHPITTKVQIYLG